MIVSYIIDILALYDNYGDKILKYLFYIYFVSF